MSNKTIDLKVKVLRTSVDAIVRLSEKDGMTKTEEINEALRVYTSLRQHKDSGKKILIYDEAKDKYQQVLFAPYVPS
ncbi:MAG: hypothetical protein ABIC91_02450 [Nanoarchaeota archaeon]|nr:hypothetical protein [Nanoarchaeota archaeon]MBU1030103.1 hypothetical protein [Nanoarchaeota archaeon]MBU1849986.1 hypothetical protein [Nanoarchaeota archaeon]